MAGGGSGQHSAKGTKQHSIMRSAKNKRTGKYDRQRHRTDARRARRQAGDTCKGRRLEMRRMADLELIESGEVRGGVIMALKRQKKRDFRARWRRMDWKARKLARERVERKFQKGAGA